MILTVVNVGSFVVLYESDHFLKKQKLPCVAVFYLT